MTPKVGLSHSLTISPRHQRHEGSRGLGVSNINGRTYVDTTLVSAVPGCYALCDVGADIFVKESVVEVVVDATHCQHVTEVLALFSRYLNTEKTVLAPGSRQTGNGSG